MEARCSLEGHLDCEYRNGLMFGSCSLLGALTVFSFIYSEMRAFPMPSNRNVAILTDVDCSVLVCDQRLVMRLSNILSILGL